MYTSARASAPPVIASILNSLSLKWLVSPRMSLTALRAAGSVAKIILLPF